MRTKCEYVTPEQIHQMAINHEEEALQAAVTHGVINIDELYTPIRGMLFPPVVFLAMHQKDAAVDILLKCGARVRHAVFGAAFGGHLIALEKYLTMPGGTQQRAAEGAAFGGQFELLSKIASENWGKLDKSRIAFYLASRGYEDTLSRYIETAESIQFAANGAALAGKFDLLSNLQYKGGNDKECLLFFLAQGNHREAIFSFIQDGVAPQQAANGAALAGHFDLLDVLTRRYPSLEQADILYYLAFGGHQTEVLEHPKLRKHLHAAASGAIRNCHMTLLMHLNRIGLLGKKWVVNQLTEAGHLDVAHAYSEINAMKKEEPFISLCRFFMPGTSEPSRPPVAKVIDSNRP